MGEGSLEFYLWPQILLREDSVQVRICMGSTLLPPRPVLSHGACRYAQRPRLAERVRPEPDEGQMKLIAVKDASTGEVLLEEQPLSKGSTVESAC